MKEGDDNTSATVRDRVHKCAYYQAKTNDNSKRQSGYSKAMKVEPVWLSQQTNML